MTEPDEIPAGTAMGDPIDPQRATADVLALVLRVLLDDLGMSQDAVAEWLSVPSSWLDGAAPLMLLVTDPARVEAGVTAFAAQRGDRAERVQAAADGTAQFSELADDTEREAAHELVDDAITRRADAAVFGEDTMSGNDEFEQLVACEHELGVRSHRAVMGEDDGRVWVLRGVPTLVCDRQCGAAIRTRAVSSMLADHADDMETNLPPFPATFISEWTDLPGTDTLTDEELWS